MSEHILSLSYGKDPLACLGAIEDDGILNAPQTPIAGRVSTPRHIQENATCAEFGANWGIRKEIP
jgi:hypothetical protein